MLACASRYKNGGATRNSDDLMKLPLWLTFGKRLHERLAKVDERIETLQAYQDETNEVYDLWHAAAKRGDMMTCNKLSHTYRRRMTETSEMIFLCYERMDLMKRIHPRALDTRYLDFTPTVRRRRTSILFVFLVFMVCWAWITFCHKL